MIDLIVIDVNVRRKFVKLLNISLKNTCELLICLCVHAKRNEKSISKNVWNIFRLAIGIIIISVNVWVCECGLGDRFLGAMRG